MRRSFRFSILDFGFSVYSESVRMGYAFASVPPL